LEDADLLLEVWKLYPEIYASQRLGVELTHQQVQIARALVDHRRVLVRAGHSIGKDMLMAVLTLWNYELWNPGVTLTTAPTQQQLEHVLWAEIRKLARNINLQELMPKSPRIGSEDHVAVGYTARDSSSFQGRHGLRQLILFDEAVAIEPEFWEAADSMLAGSDCLMLACCNPTTTTCQMYREEMSGRWHIIEAPSTEHPNVVAELKGEPLPIPGAVTLSWVTEQIERWSAPSSNQPGNLEWPPSSGKWWKPGQIVESRVLGKWPTSSTDGVWSASLFDGLVDNSNVACSYVREELQIGCDVALQGSDYTVIVQKRDQIITSIEMHQGWDINRTKFRLREIADGEPEPLKVPIKIDSSGIGAALMTHAEEYNFIPVNAGSTPQNTKDFVNIRSELWFNTVDLARDGKLKIDHKVEHLDKLRTHLLSPKWNLNEKGQRVVEPKERTKSRLGVSPDLADAFNLACYTPAKRKVIWGAV